MLPPSLSPMPCSPLRPRQCRFITLLLFQNFFLPPVWQDRHGLSVILRNLPTKVKARGDFPAPVMQRRPFPFPLSAVFHLFIPSAPSPSFGPGYAPQGHQDDKEYNGL